MPLAAPGGRPEPDLALAETTTSRHHPTTAALVVEVAVSSLGDDLTKLPSYASAGIGAAWLVDVPRRVVHVYTEPSGREYRAQQTLRSGDVLVAPVDGVPPLAVDDLFAVLDR